MNFGLFSSETDVMRWVLIGIALAVCLWVAIWIGRAKPSRFAQVAAGMLIGGALGNVVDRLLYGAVADFLNMSLPGWRNPYSFNVADIAIFLGAMGLVLQPPEKKPAPKKRKAPGAAARSAAAPAADEARSQPRPAASGSSARAGCSPDRRPPPLRASRASFCWTNGRATTRRDAGRKTG
ncbi:signal peptidase II [Paracoccus mutanolyticus]|uniref:signal peptidase II n=1 Tax=Paracoccus mutanolyticus TaxID=1499308 RepID=UPI00167A73E6|nr:signal peptidase II [Paracoccus mutanolyticus]